MRLPSIRRITRADIQNAPDWIDQLLTPLNLFLETVYAALNKGLTFDENFSSIEREFTFRTSADYATGTFTEIAFDNTLPRKARHLSIGQLNEIADNEVVLKTAITPNWIETEGRIRVRYISGLEASKRYGVRFLVV